MRSEEIEFQGFSEIVIDEGFVHDGFDWRHNEGHLGSKRYYEVKSRVRRFWTDEVSVDD